MAAVRLLFDIGDPPKQVTFEEMKAAAQICNCNGALGFLIGLVFVLTLFTPTLRAAINEPSIDRRYVSLACTGSFVAILLHSLVDFNLYIPANAMLLAWIGGTGAARVSKRFW